jgi:hypothetical protein
VLGFASGLTQRTQANAHVLTTTSTSLGREGRLGLGSRASTRPRFDSREWAYVSTAALVNIDETAGATGNVYALGLK